MARKSRALSIVSDEPKEEADSIERFRRRTFHLKTGTGQPLDSALFLHHSSGDVMLGHRVRLTLTAPAENISGELRQQNVEGVWIYGGFQEQAKLRFYPQHRIVEIEDAGPVYR